MFQARRASSTLGPLAHQLARATLEPGAQANQAMGAGLVASEGMGPGAARSDQGALPLAPRPGGAASGSQSLTGRGPRAGVPGGRLNPGLSAGGTGPFDALAMDRLPPVLNSSVRGYGTSPGHTTALQQVIADQVALLDQVFVSGDMKQFDEIYEALDAMKDAVRADPAARIDHRDAMSALMALSQDAAPLLEAVLHDGVDSMEALAEHFDLDDDLKTLPSSLEGICQLDPDECLALSLYSVRKERMPLGPEVFRAVNALDRVPLPAAAQALQFLTEPLASGMAKLPELNGVQLRRGMQIGEPGDMGALSDAKAQFAAGETLDLGAPTTGSLTAAYPGNVVLLVQSAAQGSSLKDTSAFSYVGDLQKEATFMPGTRLQITRADEMRVPKEWAQADQTVASSDRTWGAREGQPVLVVQAKEVLGGAPGT